MVNNGSEKIILDACCGSRMMWFDKNNPLAIFADIRNESVDDGYGRIIHVKPDVVMDFRKMDYSDDTFQLVAFDPPHSKYTTRTSIMGKLYGQLLPTWKVDIKAGFDECIRVLKPNGILIFKWHVDEIKLSQLLEVLNVQPLFGHTSGKHGKTIWLCFIKSDAALKIKPKSSQQSELFI